MSPKAERRTLLGALRRRLRRRKRPRELELLRLILTVRKLQHGQLALVQRFDELRNLRGALESFRAGAGSLEAELGSARAVLEDLGQVLRERLEVIAEAEEEQDPPPQIRDPLVALEARFERLEQLIAHRTGAPLLELPSSASAELEAELARLRGEQVCEREALRRATAELEGLRAKLRSTEIARVEIETRHTTELAQFADHARELVVSLEGRVRAREGELDEARERERALGERIVELEGKLALHEANPADGPAGPGAGSVLADLMSREERPG